MTRSSVSGVMSGHSGSPLTSPALLCTMSTPPYCASAAANIASTDRASATSVRTKAARPPASWTSPTVSDPPASSTSATITEAPAAANASADARPMPDAAPVTIATLSVMSIAKLSQRTRTRSSAGGGPDRAWAGRNRGPVRRRPGRRAAARPASWASSRAAVVAVDVDRLAHRVRDLVDGRCRPRRRRGGSPATRSTQARTGSPGSRAPTRSPSRTSSPTRKVAVATRRDRGWRPPTRGCGSCRGRGRRRATSGARAAGCRCSRASRPRSRSTSTVWSVAGPPQCIGPGAVHVGVETAGGEVRAQQGLAHRGTADVAGAHDEDVGHPVHGRFGSSSNASMVGQCTNPYTRSDHRGVDHIGGRPCRSSRAARRTDRCPRPAPATASAPATAAAAAVRWRASRSSSSACGSRGRRREGSSPTGAPTS